VRTNYIGVAYNGYSILAYGKNGRILLSTDGGINWKESQIADTLNIVSIGNLNNRYFALSSNGYVFESNDNRIIG
jgi:photosystem II stability/assembly factor-like uncharacterized protein